MEELQINYSYTFNYSGNHSFSPSPGLPPGFNINVLIQVIIYCILLIIAAAGNLTVLISLIRGRHRKSRISLMMMHLTIADLMVTFIMIPLEIGWRITVQWRAGNIACKIFTFLRAFGLYLSSNVLVCVSLDRYFAILHPLRHNDARRRGKIMIALAWTFSFLCASPQSVVFHVSQHPNDPNFHQCVTFDFFQSESQEISYNLFCVSVMYFIPLLVIIFAYSCILVEISNKSRETKEDQKDAQKNNDNRGRLQLRRSDMSNIARARSRTLRMTITIVVAFIWCWTPYVVMTLWYMFDRRSAMEVDPRIQDAFFIMAVSNSCMNPIVYGSYAMNLRKDCICLGRKYTSTQNLIRRSTSAGKLPLKMIRSKQDHALLHIRNCLPHLKVRSTANTKTTVFDGAHRSRFTFNPTSNIDGLKAGPHSEVYLPPDDEQDSGVSFTYRGRPYHSEPPQQGIYFDLTYLRSDSADGIAAVEVNENAETNGQNSGKICSFTISNTAFLKRE